MTDKFLNKVLLVQCTGIYTLLTLTKTMARYCVNLSVQVFIVIVFAFFMGGIIWIFKK